MGVFYAIKLALGSASVLTEWWLYRRAAHAAWSGGVGPVCLAVLLNGSGLSVSACGRQLLSQPAAAAMPPPPPPSQPLSPGAGRCCRTVARQYRPAVANAFLALLCLSAGMFVASTGFLPSSFTMYALTAAAAGVLGGRPYAVIAAAVIGGCASGCR